MDQMLSYFIALSGQIDTYAHPVTKIALPLCALFLASKLLGSIWRRVLGPLLVGEVRWMEMGEWAVVAGGSYGIGALYAKELAKRGCNLIIIGHDAVGRLIYFFSGKQFSFF